MLPSQFLNVVLEEIEGDVDTAKPECPEPSPLKDLINSPLRQQLSSPLANETKPNKINNNNSLFVDLEFPKRLPEAFLDECTVEVCKGPAKKSLPEPRFEVLLLPIYSNKSGSKNNGKSQWRELERDEDQELDESAVEMDALPEVEAVYSDHDTESDEEIVFEDPPPHHIESVNKKDGASTTPGKLHMCKFCHKIFPNKGVLWTHTTIAHADKLSCECPICGRIFHRNCNLAVHLKSHEAEGITVPEAKLPEIPKQQSKSSSTNPADRPFKCPYCTKSYSQRSVLKKHMVIHTGERLTCNLCGIDFTQKSSLLRHVKRLHSGDRSRPPYARTPRKVPPLLNLRLTDQIKKVLAAASQPQIPPKPQQSTDNSDDLSDSTKHSNNSEETEHSVDMPEQMANFIQSLKIPQGISISMIDD